MELDNALIFVCLLNQHIKVPDAKSVQNKLQHLSRQTKSEIKKIAGSLGLRVASLELSGKLLDLHEVCL